MQDLSIQPWFQYLGNYQQNLVVTSYTLLRREKQNPSGFGDYSFIIFSMAKAYEGFLKNFLFDLGLISQRVYEGKRFRIGRALNPDIYERHRDEHWLFDDVVKICGKDTADTFWKTWLTCRNRVFHFFPKEKGVISFLQAEKRLEMMREAMNKAMNCVKK